MATPIQPVRGTVDNRNYVSDGAGGWIPEVQPDPFGGGAVTIADGADVCEGAKADIAVPGDNDGTVSGKLRYQNKVLADVWDTILHAYKVSIQNATLAVTQSGSWVLSAGAAIIGKVGIDQTTPGTTNGVVVNSSALPTGAATETTLGTRLSESDFDTKIGSLTETAPATDTASSGLNGRLQRIAQRITSLITALGSPFQAGGSIGNTTFASTVANGANVALGTTTDAAIITDATGTVQQYLRGLIKLAITAGGFLVTATIAAGTALIGKVASADSYDVIYNGTTALTPKFAKISTSTSGASEVVAAVAAKKIVVTQVVLIANAAVNVKFQSHVIPTDLTGLLYLAANTGFAPGYDPTGHFQTIAGEALDINLSGNVAVGGWLKYIEV